MRWSNSALYTLQQCGERFRRKYIERDFRPSGVRAKRGTAVHKIANESHMRQLRAKEGGAERAIYLASVLPTAEEAKDLAATAFDAAMGEGCAFSDDEQAIGVDKVTGEQKDAAVQMSEHYVGAIAPRVDPVGVERRVTIKPEGSDIEITGIVDLVSEELPTAAFGAPQPPPTLFDEPGPLSAQRRVVVGAPKPEPEPEKPKLIEVVNDLKTADRQPQEDAASRSQQLALYALIRTAEKGRPPDKVRLRTLVRTRTGKTSSVEQTAEKTEQDLEAVAQRLNAAIETVKRGVFVPANPEAWWCSQKFCEYWGDCVYSLGKGR